MPITSSWITLPLLRNMFVGSHEALPPPLTLDEEMYLIDKLSHGEQQVKRMIIERNLRLVVCIARKFDNTGIGLEDLASIGTIGLIKAVNTFDPAKKIKLSLMLPNALKMKSSCCGATINCGQKCLLTSP